MFRTIYRVSGILSHTKILFIYFKIPVFYGFSGSLWALLWSAKSLMRWKFLIDLFRDIYDTANGEVSVMETTCGQTWSKSALQLPLISLRAEFLIQWAHIAFRGVDGPPRGKYSPFLYENQRVSHDKIIAISPGGFKNGGWNGVITPFIIWSVPTLYWSQNSLPNAPQYVNCSYLPTFK